MPGVTPERKPWPMKWIIAAIVVFIAGYTFLTLHYRKPGPSYQPYEDMKKRANTGRLLSAGFQRVELVTARPADGAFPTPTAKPAAGGLPEALRTTLISAPLLPTDILAVHAAATVVQNAPYEIEFRCITPDDKQAIGNTELYARGDEITITPRFERLSGGLQSRTAEHRVLVVVPAGALKPGSYHVTLVGSRSSCTWTLQVR